MEQYKGRLAKQQKHIIRKIRIKKGYEKALQQKTNEEAEHSALPHFLKEQAPGEEKEEAKLEQKSVEEESNHDRQVVGKIPKRNPYAGVLKEQQKIKQQKLTQRQQKEEEFKKRAKEREVALQKRKEQTVKMRARDQKGQPKMGQQVSVLLDRIKKSVS